MPPDAEQLGGAAAIDTGDPRLTNVTYRNGSLWTAHTIKSTSSGSPVPAVRWVQVDVSVPGAPAVVQDGILGAEGVSHFFPAVMPDSANNLGVAFARAGPAEYASVYYTARAAADPAGTLRPIAALRNGVASYVRLDSSNRNRWGDYSGIALDPLDESFWILGEYAASVTTWGTWGGNFFVEHPVPAITRLNPESVTVGGSNTTLDVIGTGFVRASVVQWNGTARATTFVTTRLLRITISAADRAVVGSALATVLNPAPGGGVSATATLQVDNPVPYLGSLSPSWVVRGSPDLTLSVLGSNFLASSVVRWNGASRPTTVVSSSQLRITVPASELAAAGTAHVSVYTPPPGGGTAPWSAPFDIYDPSPVLTWISPSEVAAGTPSFTLTLEGQNFLPSSVVRVNGSTRPAEFVSDTRLRATVSANDVPYAGSSYVYVSTPSARNASATLSIGVVPTVFPLGVTASGAGTLTSTPSGISCGTLCTATFGSGRTVTLQAAPSSGWAFGQWSGCDATTGTTCTVTMSAARTASATFAALRPDLIVTGVTPSATSVRAGSRVSVTATVANQGQGDASPSTTRFYLSSDAIKDPRDRRLVPSQSVPALAPGDSATRTTTVAVPRTTRPGLYRLVACAADGAHVAERDRTNNCLAAAATLEVLGADVAVDSVTALRPSVRAGDRLAVEVVVANHGALAVRGSTLRHFLSTDATKGPSDAALAGTLRLGPLAPATSTHTRVPLTVPSTIAGGSYYVVACVEDLDTDRERDAANDCRASTAPVQIIH